MSYIPHTEQDRQQMLAAIGVTTIEDLFDAVPPSHRFPKLKMPEALSEMEIASEMQALAEANDHAGNYAIFRGAGAYHHFTPSVVNHILLRCDETINHAGGFTLFCHVHNSWSVRLAIILDK